MKLSSIEIARIRQLAARVRQLKEQNYDGVTWEQVKKEVARSASSSSDEYYTTLALFQYFIDEGRALSSLGTFLEGADEVAVNLRERDLHYAVDEAERTRIRVRVDAYLQRVGTPATSKAAFYYYQVLIDRVFTSTTLGDLLDTLDRLASTLEKWYPQAFPEVQFIARAHGNLLRLTELAASPISIRSASAADSQDFSPLKQILHRFVSIGVFAVQKDKRQSLYKYVTSNIDTNQLRREWEWLWCQPGERLSLKLYE
jgi:RNA processing factor Prp31